MRRSIHTAKPANQLKVAPVWFEGPPLKNTDATEDGITGIGDAVASETAVLKWAS